MSKMYTAMLTLKVVSPLAIHARRASEQFAPTLDYVPGGTVRGAFADLYLAGDPKRAQESNFREIFLSDKVFFSDFLPTNRKNNSLTRLRPATAVACKRFHDHQVNSLSDSLLWMELLQETDDPTILKVYNQWKRCPECENESPEINGKRDRAGGGYYDSVNTPEHLEVRKRMIANTAIERSTQTAATTLLFSHEVLEESGTIRDQEVFIRGVIRMPDDLRDVLKDLALNNRLAVGYGRSRGLGQLYLDASGWATPSVMRQSVRERWNALNEAALALWGRFDLSPKGQYFSLTLQSHLAMRGLSAQPILEDIQPVNLGFPLETDLCYCVLNAVAVSGWNAALGLPKADIWALERGSVLLFRLPHDVDPQPVIKRLEELEEEGAGDHRPEGFGHMIACDPIHSKFIVQDLKGGL